MTAQRWIPYRLPRQPFLGGLSALVDSSLLKHAPCTILAAVGRETDYQRDCRHRLAGFVERDDLGHIKLYPLVLQRFSYRDLFNLLLHFLIPLALLATVTKTLEEIRRKCPPKSSTSKYGTYTTTVALAHRPS